MATSDVRSSFDRTRARYCSNCGSAVGQGHFCSSCGHALIDEPDTEQLESAQGQEAAEPTRRFDRNGTAPVTGLEAAERLTESAPARYEAITAVAPPAPGTAGAGRWWTRRRGWSLGATALVVLAAAAGAAVLVLSSSSGGAGDVSTYREQVATVFAPVLNANRNLSSALADLHGRHSAAALRATSGAQDATSAAGGGLGQLNVPQAARQVASEARQALDRESTYLLAVSVALRHPASPGVSQVQTLAGNVTSTLDAIGPPMAGAGRTVSGADALTTWAQRRARVMQAGNSSQTSSAGGGTTGAPVPSVPLSFSYMDYTGPLFSARLPTGDGWSAPAESQPTPGRLYRTSVQGPGGMFALIDYTPSEPAVFGGHYESRTEVGQTAFGTATKYVFQGGKFPQCQNTTCVDYIINNPNGPDGFGVLAGGGSFGSAAGVAETIAESVSPAGD